MRKQIFSRKLMSWLLALCLITGQAMPAMATNTTNDGSVEITELNKPYALEKAGKGNENMTILEEYAPDQEVTVVVELEDKALLEYSQEIKSHKSAKNFIKSSKGKNINSNLKGKQQKLFKDLQKAASGKVSLENQFTVVMNGMAVKTQFKNLSVIQKAEGVKNAFVAEKHYLADPDMENSVGMIGADRVWETTPYTGKGTLVAVIDSGLDIKHEAFQTAPENPVLTKDKVAELLASLDFSAEKILPGVTVDDVYHNQKVVFQFDYEDKDANVGGDTPEIGAQIDHGTHVAGTVAGYLEDEEGKILFSGVAPDAQLVILKVFGDSGSGAYTNVILAALEDAVHLGVDAVNMSLGSSAGFSYGGETVSAVYKRVADAGINIMISAGNATDSAQYNNYGYNMALTSNPDTGILGAPSAYPQATSVASINNVKIKSSYIKAGEREIVYTDTPISIKNIAGEHEYVAVPNFGNPEDFNGIDVNGKIALISRGSIAFTEKVANATKAGAKAVIIYDNAAGALTNMVSDGNTIPAIFISKSDGDYMRGLENKVVTIMKDELISVDNSEGNKMSAFTSIGVTPDLKLKPEITAPGGSIYSTIPNSLGKYGNMSGTSMAAPHMSGAVAIMQQYVNEEYPNLTAVQKEDLINQLLMSTAEPVVDPGRSYYSPRKQGSGLANLYNAINTPAYLSVQPDEDGNVRPKLSLGDDPQRTGVYKLSFIVNNLSNEELTYNIDTTALSPMVASDGTNFFMRDYVVKLNASVAGPESVTVPANGSAVVNLTLTVDVKNSYIPYFENGIYVEGFVRLLSEENPNLTIPFLAFYGDWTEAPIMDSAAWFEETAENMASNFTHQAGTGFVNNLLLLGTNPFSDGITRDSRKFVISPNGDGYFDGIELLNTGLMRNARTLSYIVTNNSNGQEYMNYTEEYVRKSVYNSTAGRIMPAVYSNPWRGTDAKGEILKSGTEVTYTIQGILDFDDHKQNNKKDSWSFPVTIDTTKPELSTKDIRIVKEGDKYYLMGSIKDNHYLAYVAVGTFAQDKGFDKMLLEEVFVGDEKGYNFKVDVTDYLNNELVISAVDYGLNERSISVNLPKTKTVEVKSQGKKSIELVENKIDIIEGESYQIRAAVREDVEKVTWTSSDPKVATVDENGVVTAHKKGNVKIYASDGKGFTTFCTVKVANNKK